ncbi:hypothetical protein BGZ58_001152 [Dissophora ornata]|nr:hypothetical protein BGZ58_001152 [Dissophora ornata]
MTKRDVIAEAYEGKMGRGEAQWFCHGKSTQKRLAVRFGIKSNTTESQLPVHTPIPAPPIRLHTPADRNAVPAAPAIKITSPHSGSPPQAADSTNELIADADIVAGKKARGAGATRFADDVKYVEDSKEGSAVPQTRPPKSPRFLDSDHPYPPLPFTPPTSPTAMTTPGGISRTSGNSNVVTFQNQPYSRMGDSTNSDAYPTFATYRQSQNSKFDAFAQRIRKALETANAQHQMEQENLERLRQEQRQQETPDYSEKTKSSQDQNAGMVVRQASNELTTASTSTASALSPSTLSVVQGGRPRSSSTASMMSNLSEKMRIGADFFGRAGRSRAASDASLKAPPAPPMSSSGSRMNPSSTSSSRPPAIPAYEIASSSSITTMAAIASAAAVASAMSIPRSSAYNSGLDARMEASDQAIGGDGKRSDVLLTSGKQSSPAHPLAETMHVKDNSYDNDPPLEKSNRLTDDDHILLVMDADSDHANDDQEKDSSGRRRRGGDSSVSNDIQVLVGELETKNER